MAETLGDLARRGEVAISTGPFGSALHAHDYQSTGVPVIPTEAIEAGRLRQDKIVRISEQKARELARHRLQLGDIVFARRGAQACGLSARVTENDAEAIAGTGVITLRILNREKIDPGFLACAVGAPDSVKWLKHHAIGATMPNLNSSVVLSLPINLPDIASQRAIALIFSTLDDKVELNRRMSETLEAIARALFKSWFVDFDPVRAKSEGHDPVLAPPLADLFPDSFENSALGDIPKGWEVAAIGENARCEKGKSYKSVHLQDSDTALVTLKSFARGGGYRPDGLKGYTGDFKREHLVLPGELVVACTDVTQAAEVIGKPALVRSSDEYTTLVASLDVLVVRPRSNAVSVPFLYCLFRTDRFADHTYAHSTGTTVLHLAKDAVPSYQFVRPTEKVSETFASITNLIFKRIDEVERESRTLAALRDSLVPKLVSGTLRVAGAERIARDA